MKKTRYIDTDTIKKGLDDKILQERKLILKIVKRNNDPFINYSAGDDPKHKAFGGKWTGAIDTIVLPVDRSKGNGQLVTIFTESERNYFAGIFASTPNAMNENMPGNEFTTGWHYYIKNTEKFKREGEELDLAKPIDNLYARILAASPFVYNTTDAFRGLRDSTRSPEHKYILIDKEAAVDEQDLEDKLKLKCTEFVILNKTNKQKLYNFLKVFAMMNKSLTKPPAENMDVESYQLEIKRLIDKHLYKVDELIKKDDFNERLALLKGVDYEIIKYDYKTDIYSTIEGNPIGKGMEQAISWYKDPLHQTNWLELNGLIEDREKTK